MKYPRRLLIALMLGVVLGVVCIIGAQVRSGFTQEPTYLFAFWYNRVIMGALIGLAPAHKNLKTILIRGAVLGVFVSFAFYVSTGFSDHIGFMVGAVYGMIIEAVLWHNHRQKT